MKKVGSPQIPPPSLMRVLVAAFGHELGIDIGREETVLGIKEKLEVILGVPVPLQVLAVLGWELLDGLDMDDYPIVSEGTRIDLSVKSSDLMSPRRSRIGIIVKFSSQHIRIEIDRTETVLSLKEKIHLLEGTLEKRMSLFFSGEELEDDSRFLTDYGIRESSEVVVRLKNSVRSRDEPSKRTVDIVVQTSSSLLNSAAIPVEIEDSCTLNDLRQLLLRQKTLPPDDYIFVHKQRIMREECSLRWHGVENGDSLYVFQGTVTRSSN